MSHEEEKNRYELARQAALAHSVLSHQTRNQALITFAKLLGDRADFLLNENKKDLQEQKGQITEALYSRLKLDQGKIQQLVEGIRNIARMPDPIHTIQWRRELDDGLILEKILVPLGVLGIIFESRPDVIPQILSLVLKTGNAALLKGGHEARFSNLAFMKLVHETNQICGLHFSWAQLLDTRADVAEMLKQDKYIDLVIPRGSNELVQMVQASTKIPVLGHADGICHIYVHVSADQNKALKIIEDSKVQYPSACNAVETLLIDSQLAAEFLPKLSLMAENKKIQLKGCPETRRYLPQIQAATDEDWVTEYGDLTLAVKLVNSQAEAIEHINRFSSHHTDAILAQDAEAQRIFLDQIDSANVFVNASTRFSDGFRYGFGAEVGISTSKTHARGPVGIEGLVTYKYILRGEGQVVRDYVGTQAKSFKHKNLKEK